MMLLLWMEGKFKLPMGFPRLRALDPLSSFAVSVVPLPCDDPMGTNALSWGARPESSGGGQKA